jgi:HTH-like domain
LSVSQAWFYKWRDGDRSPRHARRAQLTAAIKQIFADRHDTYGSPRVTDDLREAGWRVSEKTVAKIMRELGLAARVKKRRKHTTRPGRGRWRAPDLIGRDFPASTVNQKWYGDGTEIPTDEGKLCSSLPALPVDATIRSLRPGRRRRGPWSPLRWPTRAPTRSPAVRYWSEDQYQLVERDADPILHGQVGGHIGWPAWRRVMVSITRRSCNRASPDESIVCAAASMMPP